MRTAGIIGRLMREKTHLEMRTFGGVECYSNMSGAALREARKAHGPRGSAKLPLEPAPGIRFGFESYLRQREGALTTIVVAVLLPLRRDSGAFCLANFASEESSTLPPGIFYCASSVRSPLASPLGRSARVMPLDGPVDVTVTVDITKKSS